MGVLPGRCSLASLTIAKKKRQSTDFTQITREEYNKPVREDVFLQSITLNSVNNMSTFSELINTEKPVLVDFFATWCGPCKTMAPMLEELKKKVGDTATVIKIDVDKNPAVAAKYQIQGVPTLMVFKEGKMVWRQSGVVPVHQLEQVIQRYK